MQRYPRKIFKPKKHKQAISAHERALCQLTVCFDFKSDRRTQKLCPANVIQKESNKVTVEV